MTQNKLNVNVEEHDPIAKQLMKWGFNFYSQHPR